MGGMRLRSSAQAPGSVSRNNCVHPRPRLSLRLHMLMNALMRCPQSVMKLPRWFLPQSPLWLLLLLPNTPLLLLLHQSLPSPLLLLLLPSFQLPPLPLPLPPLVPLLSSPLVFFLDPFHRSSVEREKLMPRLMLKLILSSSSMVPLVPLLPQFAGAPVATI